MKKGVGDNVMSPSEQDLFRRAKDALEDLLDDYLSSGAAESRRTTEAKDIIEELKSALEDGVD